MWLELAAVVNGDSLRQSTVTRPGMSNFTLQFCTVWFSSVISKKLMVNSYPAEYTTQISDRCENPSEQQFERMN